MLTYNLQPRYFSIKTPGGSFRFPNKTIIEIKLAPPSAFGAKNEPGRGVFQGKMSQIYNANTGKMIVQSCSPIEPLQVVVELSGNNFELNGDILKLEKTCTDIIELDNIIKTLYYYLPIIFNLYFYDPPTVEYTRGWVGEVQFNWEHKQCNDVFEVVNKKKRETAVSEAINLIPLFTGTENRRLAAALHYLHVASRLTVSGKSPWEFMSEIILNMSKVLEILFIGSNDSRNDVRRELSKLGYSQEEIEGDYISILILRSFLDVAHPRIVLYDINKLIILYNFLSTSEMRFRELLKRLLNAVADGTYELRPTGELTLNKKDQKRMQRLLDTIESRLSNNK